MNKKIIAVMLTLVMIVGYSFSAMAGTLTEVGSEPQDVKGKFTTAPTTSYSVTITWDSLTYEYGGALKWDENNNCYTDADDTADSWTTTGGNLTVINNSSVDVNAKVEFALNNSNIVGPSGSFTGDLSGTPLQIPTKATNSTADNDKTAILEISGKPEKIYNYTVSNYQNFTIGSVTVTIS